MNDWGHKWLNDELTKVFLFSQFNIPIQTPLARLIEVVLSAFPFFFSQHIFYYIFSILMLFLWQHFVVQKLKLKLHRRCFSLFCGIFSASTIETKENKYRT